MTGLEFVAVAKIWQWIREHKAATAGIAIMAAVAIAAVVAWGSWYSRGVKLEAAKSKIERLKADHEREVADLKADKTALLERLTKATASAVEWKSAATACDDGVKRWIMEAERQKLAVKTERERLAAERRARREAEARLAEAITATECEDAVRQLAEVLR